TYTVHSVPNPTFDLNPFSICADGTSEATITFTGSIYSNNAVFNWNFNGGTQVSGQAPDPIGVVWDGLSGTANVSLSITENGCTSSIETESIILEQPLAAPNVICAETTSSSVRFEWQHIDFAFGYEVTYTINNGSPTTLSSFNAFFDVTNLNIGDVINIEVVAIGDDPCGNGFAGTAECTVEDCPELNIGINNLPESYCSDAGIVILEATPEGGTFSGDGVSGNEFDPSLVDFDNANIQYTYTDVNTGCEYNTSANVAIIEVPFAEFEISPNTLCANGNMEAIVSFTGTANLNATPNWDFGGGIAVPSTGFGPHTVTWADAQTSNEVSLNIDNQGCISNTFSEKVVLVAPIEAFEVSCAGTSTTTVSFDWEDVPNAEGYEITYSLNGETTNAPIHTFNSEFALNELATNDTIEILVIAIATEPCGNVEATAICITNDCPDISLEINNLNESYCSNEASFGLSAIPEGGVFVGEGIEEGNVFNPSLAAIGANSIEYQYTDEESGCEYSLGFEVNVEAPLTTPFVNCVESTQTSITFEWTIIEGAVNYEITYTVNGSGETSETLDSSPFEVTGLSPQDEVNISVIAIGEGVCGNSEAGSSNCVAQDCPPLDLSITNLDGSYCNDVASFAIEAIPTGGVFRIGSTEYTYSNANFNPANLGEGEHLIEYIVTEGDCSYSTTAMVEIFGVPNASFEVDVPSICLTDGATISFNGTTNAAATYDWDFDGGTTEAMGGETYTVTWTTAGIKNIRLQVTQNECTSEWFEESIDVNAPLDAPIVTCGNSSTNSVSFNWEEVPPFDFQITYTVNGENPMTTNTSDNSFEVGDLTPQDEVEISVTILNDGVCGNSEAATQTCMAEDCVEIDLTINGLASEYCSDMAAVSLEATPVGGVFYVNGNEATTFDPADLGGGTHLIEYVLEQGDCNYSTSLSVEVFESLAAVNINCSNSSTSSVSFNWGNLGNYEFELTYTVNNENPMSSTTTDNSFSVDGLNPQDLVELTVTILNDGVCGDSPSSSESCIAQDCDIVDLSIDNVEAIYCSDAESISLIATPEGGTFYINNEETSIFDPAVLGEGTHLIEYLWMQGDCPYSTNLTIEVVAPLEVLSINCGENGTNFVSFDWEDLGGEYDFEVTYTVNGENPMTETIHTNSFEVNGLNPQDTVEIGVLILNDGVCGNSPIASQTCISQNCEILDLNIEGLDIEYCSDAEIVTLAANIEGGTFFINGDESAVFDPTLLGAGTYLVEYILEQNNCPYNTELSVEIIEPLEAITLNCGNSTPNSVSFNWGDLDGLYDFEVTYTVNGENPITETIHTNSFEVNNLTPQDSVEISLVVLNDGICGNSPAVSQTCVAQDCEALDLSIEGLDAEYCSDTESLALAANIEGGVFFINNTESSVFNPSILGADTYLIEYVLTQGDCSYSADLSVEIIAPLEVINIDCGNATTNSVSFNWEDLGGGYDFEIIYTVNGENPVTTTINDNSFEVNNLEVQDVVELSVIVLNDGICGNSPAVSQTCVAQDCEALDLSIEGLEAEYCSDATSLALAANIEGGVFFINDIESTTFNPEILGAGTHLIEYSLTQGDCSYSTDLSVEVVAPLAAPVVNCSDNTANSVRFDWEIVEGASEYHITYLINSQNPTEEILNETTIEITNLSESDRVDIEVIAIGNNLCGNSLPGLQNCTASDCPSIGFDLADAACLGENISFDLMNNGFGENAQFSWMLSNGETLQLEPNGSQSIVWEQAGWQFLFVDVEDDNGCMTMAHDSVFVSNFHLQSMTDTTILLGASMELQGLVEGAYHGILDYQWMASDGQVVDCENCTTLDVSPTASTDYSLLVTDENGCMTSASVFVEVISGGGEVVLENQVIAPNAFSPNGDGINDYFGVSGLNIASFELVIYNRWGKEMFRTQDENGAWDGRFEEEMQPIGVYAYYVVVRFEDGKEELAKGNLILIK
ncbi:MAG: gliding motility-associated C-terminal domain-containing protein, partial [Chitinophagales bacterium]